MRSGVSDKRSDGWYMMCDRCFTRTEARPLQDDFPLVEFAAKGWIISQRADVCPDCKASGEPTTDTPWTPERLDADLLIQVQHCVKYHGRLPLSPYIHEREAVAV